MKYNRRQFIKLTAGVIAAITLPSISKEPEGFDFDPNCQYGEFLTITDWNDENVAITKNQLVKQIRAIVPRKYCSSRTIKFIYKDPTYTTQSDALYYRGTIGWKYTPDENR